MKRVLSIAGSDCSGGAGIQADMKTITAHKMYAMTAITALTAQNTTGVYGVEEASPEFVGSQLDCIFQDIRPDAVKIGMVSNGDIVKVIAEKLREYKAENIVVDPVMVSTSGSALMKGGAGQVLKEELFPLARVITPNIPEAQALAEMDIRSMEDMEKAAEKIYSFTGGGVLIKGGHLEDAADDLLYSEEGCLWLKGQRIQNPNTHGTGCTLSSAIACNLAAGKDLEESVRLAKEYITGALKAGLNLGKGSGPLNHMWNL